VIRVLLVTGPPGVGKTAVLTKTVKMLRQRGFNVGGMLSREVRENGVRVGFEFSERKTRVACPCKPTKRTTGG